MTVCGLQYLGEEELLTVTQMCPSFMAAHDCYKQEMLVGKHLVGCRLIDSIQW